MNMFLSPVFYRWVSWNILGGNFGGGCPPRVLCFLHIVAKLSIDSFPDADQTRPSHHLHFHFRVEFCVSLLSCNACRTFCIQHEMIEKTKRDAQGEYIFSCSLVSRLAPKACLVTAWLPRIVMVTRSSIFPGLVLPGFLAKEGMSRMQLLLLCVPP